MLLIAQLICQLPFVVRTTSWRFTMRQLGTSHPLEFSGAWGVQLRKRALGKWVASDNRKRSETAVKPISNFVGQYQLSIYDQRLAYHCGSLYWALCFCYSAIFWATLLRSVVCNFKPTVCASKMSEVIASLTSISCEYI